ncbi:succinate dehydrogenase [ubiquinone] cytochrome b small subunit, mitochondrial-like [Halichondria panicea]|uniref:succinate dehydrogenase [ubiquinone] cytochrome b small subunit, mitochondrial-like n=1 Tax=Halichondria panicea TaxID=6063 RepID=UPI00312B5599
MATALCMARLARRGLHGRYTLPQLHAAGGVVGSPSVESGAVVRYAGSSTASKHWKYERLVTVGLVALLPAAVLYPCAVVDYGLAVTVPLHGHWGMQSVIADYSSEAMKKILHPLLYLVSLGTFAGLVYLNVADVGICAAVKLIWSK